MLDLLARLSRRRGAYVVAAIVTTLAVLGSSLNHHSTKSTASPTSTTSEFVGTDPATLVPASSTTVSPTTAGTIATSPSTVAVAAGSTIATATTVASEIGRAGDPANPGVRYPGRPDIRDNDHEAVIGADQTPVRISGFSAWVVRLVQATASPTGTAGNWARLTLRLVNRNDTDHLANQGQFTLRRPDGVVEPTQFATPTLVSGVQIAGNGEAFGEVWFPTTGPGRYWLAFRPDQGSARGIWAVDVA